MACEVVAMHASSPAGAFGGPLPVDQYDSVPDAEQDLQPRQADQPSGSNSNSPSATPTVKRTAAHKSSPFAPQPTAAPDMPSLPESDEQTLNGLRDGDRVRINCNNNPGIYLISSQQIICVCVQCESSLRKNFPMTPTEFERHSGMASSKKWRRSIKLGDYDNELTLGRYLEMEGFGVRANKPVVNTLAPVGPSGGAPAGGALKGRTSPCPTHDSLDNAHARDGSSPASSSQGHYNMGRQRPAGAPRGPTRFHHEATTGAGGVRHMLTALELKGEDVPDIQNCTGAAECLVAIKNQRRDTSSDGSDVEGGRNGDGGWASDDDGAGDWDAEEDWVGGGAGPNGAPCAGGGTTRTGRATRPSIRLRDTLDPLKAMKPDLFAEGGGSGGAGSGGHRRSSSGGGGWGVFCPPHAPGRAFWAGGYGGACSHNMLLAEEEALLGGSGGGGGVNRRKRCRGERHGVADDCAAGEGSDGGCNDGSAGAGGEEVAGPQRLLLGRAGSRTGSPPHEALVALAGEALPPLRLGTGAPPSGRHTPGDEGEAVVTRCRRVAGGERLAVTICLGGVCYSGLVGPVDGVEPVAGPRGRQA